MKAAARIWAAILELTPFRAGLLVFSIGLAVRLAFILLFHPYTNLARYELERVAISLATQGVYGNPYAIPTGPTAHVSPGYTLILAALFRVFGTGIPAEIIKEVLASAVVALSCALLPWVAGTLRFGRNAGLIAGLICALWPERPLVQIDGDWETPYTVLALMLVSVLAARLWTGQRLTVKNAAAHGLCWGAVMLFVSALFSMFIAFLLAGLYYCRRAGVGRYVIFAGIEVLFAALCLAPWAIRNERALGSPILTRSNFGLEMRISNNDFASPDQRVNYIQGVYARYHPLQNVTEATKVRELGEVAYNKLAMDEAKQWIRSHPVRFLQLCLGRARCFWFYIDPTSRLKSLFLVLTAALGLIGLVSFVRLQPVTGAVLIVVLLIYPLPNYLVHVGLRQQYPIQWLMILLTVFLLMRRLPAVFGPASRAQAHVRA